MDLIESKGVIRPSEKAAEQWADLIDDLEEKEDRPVAGSPANSEKPSKEQNLQQQS